MESAKSETKYERIRKIGVGSYGVVFKCVNRRTGQIVAIKRYSENDSDPTIRKIAMREVRMLRQLKHPNLIHLIEVFRRKRILHLVFDYCELTVLDVIEKYASDCPLNLIKKIIWQLVNGVSHCHSHNCIHRDIKPENILINQSGVVKLCDFGFARNLKGNTSASGASSSNSSSRTKRVQYERDAKLLGVVVPPHHHHHHHHSGAASSEQRDDSQSQSGAGDNDKENNRAAYLASERQAMTEYVATRWYRAPELLVGDIYYDVKIDIWAIGCVTAELMRGEPLWPGKTDLDQLCNIMSSLGPLTASQSHTLSTADVYDQANTERLLSVQHGRVSDPLERRVPTRVGQAGADFVLACLCMDPARRPTSDELLQHSYIRSAQMSQFVKGVASHTATATATTGGGDSSLKRHITPAHRAAMQAPPISHTNSQAILRAANQQQPPASKRLVLAPESTSPSGSCSSTSVNTSGTSRANDKRPKGQQDKHASGPAHSLVPVPVRNLREQAKQGQLAPLFTPRQRLNDPPTSIRRDKKPTAASYNRSHSKHEAPVARSSRREQVQMRESILPSINHSQQQQHQETTVTSRQPQQRLVVLVDPTERDRQRTNLDYYGKTRSRKLNTTTLPPTPP